jgi:hypothetical protein
VEEREREREVTGEEELMKREREREEEPERGSRERRSFAKDPSGLSTSANAYSEFE